MADENLRIHRAVDASAETVFAVLADPATHAAVDGTGWVQGALDGEPIAEVGQFFDMAMHHRDHPDGDYVIHNRVEVYDHPRSLGWKPGYRRDDGVLDFGGWTFRYDIAATGSDTCQVTLTYDWSGVPAAVREYLTFPVIGEDHFGRSLEHLAGLAEGARTSS